MRIIFLIVLLLLKSFIVKAQFFNLVIDRYATNNLMLSLSCLDTTYLVGGKTNFYGSPSNPTHYDAHYYHFDRYGNLLNESFVGDTGAYWSTWEHNSMIKLQNGNILSTTSMGYFNQQGREFPALVWLNPQGDTIRVRRFTNYYWDRITSVVQNASAEIFGVGTYKTSSTSNTKAYMVKFDSIGNRLSEHIVYQNDNHYCSQVLDANGQGLIVIGYRNTSTGYRPFVAYMNYDGSKNWDWYPEGLYHFGYVGISASNEIIIGAENKNPNFPPYQMKLLKFNLQKDILFNIDFNLSYKTHISTNLIGESNGNFVTVFYEIKQNNASYPFVAKFDSNGDLKWKRHYIGSDTTKSNGFRNIIKSCDGNGYVMAGTSSGYSSPYPQDGWVLKVDSFGCLVPGCQIVDAVNEQKNEDIQLSVYPNPGSNYVYVYLPHHNYNNQKLSISIKDLQGRTIDQKHELEPGTTWMIPTQNISQGIYVVQLFDQQRIISQTKWVKN